MIANKNIITMLFYLFVGSPIAESELRESTNAVGAELVRQVNHPYDPVRAIGSKKDMWEYGTSMLIASMIGRQGIAKFTPKFHPNIFGFLINPLAVVSYDLYNYHSFKTYYQNPEFQLQQTIQNLLLENAIKESNQKELSNENN
ncbi:hypothetical protein [Helicobacter apodemus]|uniref:Uncharacterized protein n=1 Tax=Helicobacter apodemus TaxID=135569 RepID=A0A2U8FD55_9HELI|nr:hypothetical protein [Helicobacter apodemus]AWI33345.1 hypothetical protein CDV25_00185 [Helicobacter apodemus]